MSPLIPRHRPLTSQPVSVKGFCLRIIIKGSTSGTRHLRGYFYVHSCYDPDSCSPALHWFCRWASEGNVSITPCHPSYMASGSYHDGTFTRKYALPFAGHAITIALHYYFYYLLSLLFTIFTILSMGSPVSLRRGESLKLSIEESSYFLGFSGTILL